MKTLVINGSPKGKQSNTYRLTSAFLEGMGATEVREYCVSRLEIKPCRGCFACWNKTPGRCVHQDDMAAVIADMLWADVIVWSFPLYYFSVPGCLKMLMDRQLPMVQPFMSADSASGSHPSRYDMSGKRHVVISTCGFYTAQGNYDGVTAIFDHLCGVDGYTTIFCGQGELFRVKELRGRTEEYLSYVRAAGQEFSGGGISEKTRMQLDTLLYPRAVFEAMADASWGLDQTGEPADETFTFTRQMAALYNKAAWAGKDIVLEMNYTDVDKRYQILLGETGSEVFTQNFREPTTCIETPYTLWKAIAAGEITGQEALAQGKYRVKGDFSLMLHWDRYFGATSSKQEVPSEQRSTNMNILLIPWIAFWAAGAVDGFYGTLISFAVCALVPLLYFRNRKTVFDSISALLVTVCGILLLLGYPQQLVLPLSYLLFGLMWTGSCFRKIPLTAHYSMNDYGGASAMQNPLFMKTNRILTACWGVLYLLTPIWTYFLMGTELSPWTGAINSILPMLMGLFTIWFQKWFPAKVARGS